MFSFNFAPSISSPAFSALLIADLLTSFLITQNNSGRASSSVISTLWLFRVLI
jgi:hypothetical protein